MKAIAFSFMKRKDYIFLKCFEFEGRLLIPGKSSEILAKEIGCRLSSPIISKLRMKVGCRRAISKTKTGKMNIVRNQRKVPTQVNVGWDV